jgi:hypothetical protein
MRLSTTTLLRFGASVTLLSIIVACQTTDDRPLQPTRPIRFEDGIGTILESRCLECHNHVDAKEMAGLNLETRKDAFTTGTHAPVIVPGSPARSMLYRVLEVDDLHPVFMPPTPDRLWENELLTLRHWIEDGANWPVGKSGRLVRPQDWPEQ